MAAAIRPYTGDLVDVRAAQHGDDADVTAVVTGATGAWFVKAVRNRPGGRRDSLVREGLVNPAIVPLAPAVRWQVENPAWVVLGFDVIEARPTGFEPGSPDLPALIDVVERIGDLDLPEVARDWPETRWDRFAGQDAAHFQGETLIHADLHPHNVLVNDDRTWVIDWSWPTRGAAFIDPALLVVQLIAAGHDAKAAETWMSGCRAWKAADPFAVDAFAAATLRMWRERVERNPDTGWLKAMATAAQEWAGHRGLTPSGR
ncbi:RIO1 family regulatory kinase/ATPase [Actinomadura vinacea]|uniref:RIO1 family regulatory kinase/ATPase domain-containing protein n=1 Tax=Actinomadura vinacea TaxID=115336 RepID=UPI0031DFBBBF